MSEPGDFDPDFEASLTALQRLKGIRLKGIRWRRCAVCRQRVWETKRGKLSRHMPKPDREGEDPIAASSFEARGPRCEGS